LELDVPIDDSTEFGSRVSRRLAEDRIAWFTTVASDGAPQPRPIWFLWNGDSFLLFSEPHGHKVRHLETNPRTSIHLDGDGKGGDIIVFIGKAFVEEQPVPQEDLDAYIEKYREGFERIGTTPEGFAKNYQTAIRMHPSKLRGH
jgi:PPOX class probable F420-dependent enzyme